MSPKEILDTILGYLGFAVQIEEQPGEHENLPRPRAHAVERDDPLFARRGERRAEFLRPEQAPRGEALEP